MTGKYQAILIAFILLVFWIAPVSAEDTVTLALPDDHLYYLGDEIPFSGISTASSTVYLLFTGPGLPPEGAPLHNPNVSVYGGGWTTITVQSDRSWEYSWQTEVLTMPAGTYTVYAVSEPRPITNLAGSSFTSISLPLDVPPHTLSVSPTIIKP